MKPTCLIQISGGTRLEAPPTFPWFSDLDIGQHLASERRAHHALQSFRRRPGDHLYGAPLTTGLPSLRHKRRQYVFVVHACGLGIYCRRYLHRSLAGRLQANMNTEGAIDRYELLEPP